MWNFKSQFIRTSLLVSLFYYASGTAANEIPFGMQGIAAAEKELGETLRKSSKELRDDQREMTFSILADSFKEGKFYEIEQNAFKSLDFANELQKTPTGQQLYNLIKVNKAAITSKIFYHFERANEIDLLHFGFTVSQNGRALIGINANQTSTEAFYSLVHEYFHLFDEAVDKADPVSELHQEIRALLFELRIFMERQNLSNHDRFSDSKFHQEFLIKENNTLSIDWKKILAVISAQVIPEKVPGKFVFDPRISKEILKIDANGQTLSGELDSGLTLHDTLLEIFNDKMGGGYDSSIVARLIFRIRQMDRHELANERRFAQGLSQLSSSYSKYVREKYSYFFEQHVRLRKIGFNDLIHGVPRPRNAGGP